jgi:hypothetical protein
MSVGNAAMPSGWRGIREAEAKDDKHVDRAVIAAETSCGLANVLDGTKKWI